MSKMDHVAKNCTISNFGSSIICNRGSRANAFYIPCAIIKLTGETSATSENTCLGTYILAGISGTRSSGRWTTSSWGSSLSTGWTCTCGSSWTYTSIRSSSISGGCGSSWTYTSIRSSSISGGCPTVPVMTELVMAVWRWLRSKRLYNKLYFDNKIYWLYTICLIVS